MFGEIVGAGCGQPRDDGLHCCERLANLRLRHPKLEVELSLNPPMGDEFRA